MARLKFRFAVFAAKLSAKLIKLAGGNATNVPGQVALWLCKDFMAQAPKTPLVVCVTGTNGKTTVSNMLADSLEADGRRVVSNRSGSNVETGCAANLLNSLTWSGKCCVDAAVYEVDERASRLVLPYVKPDFLVVTNLFRDSLKRNAHPDYIFSVIDTYCPDSTKMILNADELCSSMLKKNNSKVYYGIGKLPTDITESINIVKDYSTCPECGTKLEYDYLRYHHIGRAKCPSCDFHSFDADYLVTKVDKENNTLVVNVKGEEQIYPLISDITFNVYNELTVITTLLEIGIPKEQVLNLVSKIQVPDSRLNHTVVNGVKVVQAMSKGQSCISSCRTFDYVSGEPGKKAVVLAMDDYYDRKKSIEYIGWIYDVDYELLNKEDVVQVIATGPRCYDHKVRLLMAGVPEDKISCAEEELDGVDLIKTSDVESVYILYDTSTYNLSCRMKEKLVKNLEVAQ